MKHESDLKFGDRVIIDKDKALVGAVTGFTFRYNQYYTVEVSWVHNGTSVCAWIEPWRLERVRADDQ